MVSFTLRPLYPRGRAHGADWIGECVDPRSGLGASEKIKASSVYVASSGESPNIRLIWVYNLFGKGPQPSLWAGLRAALLKINNKW